MKRRICVLLWVTAQLLLQGCNSSPRRDVTVPEVHSPAASTTHAVALPATTAPIASQAVAPQGTFRRVQHVLRPELAIDADGLLRCRVPAECGVLDGARPLVVNTTIVDQDGPKVLGLKNQLIPLPSTFELPVQADGGVLQDAKGRIWGSYSCAAGEDAVLPYFKWRGPMMAPLFRTTSQSNLIGCGIPVGTNEVHCWSPASAPCRPQPVSIREPVQAIAVGAEHACALTTSGNVVCWGDCSYGQCGFVAEKVSDYEFELAHSIERFVQRAPRKEFLNLPSPAKEVYAGDDISCAWLANGEFWCWGDTSELPFANSGKPQSWWDRMGSGHDALGAKVYKSTFASTLPGSPMLMPEGCTATDITVLGARICVVCSSGCARCWDFVLNDSLGYGDAKNPTNGCLEF